MKRGLIAGLLLVLSAGLAGDWSVAHADRGFQHVVRDGETLASIAERYYGDPRRESVLVAENGLSAGGGSAIEIGLNLQIPYVSYHIVQEGETWAQLAIQFYGDSRRAFVLIEANRGSSSEQPDTGAQLVVPYALRHIVAQGENVLRLARLYFGPGREHSRRLRRFNNLRNNRLNRGQIVLIPLDDIALSEDGRNIITEATGQAPEADDVRRLQAEVDEELPQLLEMVRRGRYTEAVALGNRLLGARLLTGSQVVTIQRELGTAYVALGRPDLAQEAFRAALDRQPNLELDTIRTSPTVMRAFRQARDTSRTDLEIEGESPNDEELNEDEEPSEDEDDEEDEEDE